jgi:hypothetical protein
MRTCFSSVCAALLLLPALALAQGRSSVDLRDPDPAEWDVSGHAAWLAVDKTGVAPEWNRWYDVATVGASVGRFFGPHVKAEADLATSASARVYTDQQVPIPTPPFFLYISQPLRFQMTTIAGGAAYQFLDNRWFHPVVSAGIEAGRERRTVEQQFYPPTVAAAPVLEPPGTSVSWRTHPYVDAGFKWYASERAFVRSTLRTTFDRGGVAQVSWRSGFGFEF